MKPMAWALMPVSLRDPVAPVIAAEPRPDEKAVERPATPGADAAEETDD